MLPPSILTDILAAQVREAEERADRIYEPVIGIVTDNKDPDGLIRVKLKFPTLPIDDNAYWAPVSGVGAGKQRGWFFLPEVGDEVVVMFVNGDIARPVVLGAVWNGKDTAADTNGGKNERVTIVSRAGSKITLDDDAGTVTLEDGGGKGKLTISKENKITIESATGDVCLLAPDGDLNVVAKEIKLDGSMNFHIESKSGGTKLGSNAKLTIKGSGMLQISGQQTQLQPSGSPQAPKGGEASPETVSDPVGT